jgi:hypothetical protein
VVGTPRPAAWILVSTARNIAIESYRDGIGPSAGTSLTVCELDAEYISVTTDWLRWKPNMQAIGLLLEA